MFVIAGLGNPGRRYKYTRHNIGFDVIEYMASLLGISVNKIKFKGVFGEKIINGQKVILIKPDTYMNNSGECIREIVEYYKLPLENLVIIYDDVDLEPGLLRIRQKGSAGTHNGMRSIIYQLKSDEFPRIRVGIGRQTPPMDLADYVLGKISDEERRILNPAIENAVSAAQTIIKDGVLEAMNKFNGQQIK